MDYSKEQIAAGIALLRMNFSDLSDATGISRSNLSNNDSGKSSLAKASMDKISKLFESKGIRKTEYGGMEFKPRDEITKLYGRYGFRALMDSVYEVASSRGGDLFILNGSTALWIEHLGEDWYKHHALRMGDIKDNINMRIIAERGGEPIADSFAQYKWMPRRDFKNVSTYIFGENVAFITFGDELRIEIISRESMAAAQTVIFNIVWDSLA